MPDETEATTGPENVNPEQNAQEQRAADPNDEIPVPIAMEPAEIDERAQVVEALRKDRNPDATPDDPGMRA